MKACVNCKHYRSYYSVGGIQFCEAPRAKTFSRIYGSQTPVIVSKLLSDCDENGWFEQKQPHWLMRFLSGNL